MPIGLITQKCGMTRLFTEQGVSIPVTVLAVSSNYVAQMKTQEVDGYSAVQVSQGVALPSRVTKPIAGHYVKAGIVSGQRLVEFRLESSEMSACSIGAALGVDLFSVGQKVDVRGLTKGRGFSGAIRRHNFRSQGNSHGVSLAHRTLGSVGMNQSPGRVFPGKKMAGQFGNVFRTAQNQEIVKIDSERQLIFLKGAAPGPSGAYLTILPSVKRKK